MDIAQVTAMPDELNVDSRTEEEDGIVTVTIAEQTLQVVA